MEGRITTKNHTTTLNTTTRVRHGHPPRYHGRTQAQPTKRIIDTGLSTLDIIIIITIITSPGTRHLMRGCHRPSLTDRIPSLRQGPRLRCHPSRLVQRNNISSRCSRCHHCLQCRLRGTRKMSLHRRLSVADRKGSTCWTSPRGCSLQYTGRTRKTTARHQRQHLRGGYWLLAATTHRIGRHHRRPRCQCWRRQRQAQEPQRHRSRGRNGARSPSTTRHSPDWTVLDAVGVPVSTESWRRIIRFLP